VDDLWAPKSDGVGLIVRAVSFQDFQSMWTWSTNVTDRRTDRRTTCDRNTALCTKVHRAVKTWINRIRYAACWPATLQKKNAC